MILVPGSSFDNFWFLFVFVHGEIGTWTGPWSSFIETGHLFNSVGSKGECELFMRFWIFYISVDLVIEHFYFRCTDHMGNFVTESLVDVVGL